MTLRATIEKTLSEIVGPLLAVDGGGLEIVSVDETTREVVLRFTGTMTGCPGTPVVREDVVDPLLRARAGTATIRYAR